MKIENDKLVDYLVRTTSAQSKEQQAPQKSRDRVFEDNVELSVGKDRVEGLAAKANLTPLERLDKIEALKEAIKTETYNVRGELVAKSIMKTNILDEIL